jgi:hypothetical protein
MLNRHLGLGAGVAVKYQATSEHAAVLLTHGDISRSAATAPCSHFLNWVKENALKILQDERHADVREMGLWIVTKTTSAKQRAIFVATAEGTEIDWGITAEAQNAGKLEVSTSWWRSQKSSEWKSASDVSQHALLPLKASFRSNPVPGEWPGHLHAGNILGTQALLLAGNEAQARARQGQT